MEATGMIFTELFEAIGYSPHIGQVRFHASDKRFKLLIAGARFGKSLAAAKDVLPHLIAGRSTGWLVGPTYGLAQPEFRYLTTDIRDRLGVEVVQQKAGGRDGYSRVLTSWGGELWCLSANRPEGLLGHEIDWLILCEAAHIPREAFERFLRARLSTRNGKLVIATTPRGFNWVHELYQLGTGDHEDWAAFRHATWDNPLIAPREIEAARATLPPETFDEQYGGAFTSNAGAVYREFEPALHVVPNLQAPEGAIIYRGIDPGFTNPTCCLWATVDHDGRLLVLREHYASRLTADLHAAAIRAIDGEYRDRGHPIGQAWIDPSSCGFQAELAREEVFTTNAANQVLAGIDVVRRLLRRRGDGTPGMRIDTRCHNLVREFEQYRWHEGARPGERVPRKQDDHALDALRYLCLELRRRVDWKEQGASW
ncbi:MAG: hypothetical protein IT464_05110 [Planctomycetes bacterium]|nr:hypothetical protein [Planctomycetota bacterium]